jgi:hypothetical protein
MNSKTVTYIHSGWYVTHVHVIVSGLEATVYMVDTTLTLDLYPRKSTTHQRTATRIGQQGESRYRNVHHQAA